MWLRKAHAGSASGGYAWEKDGDVIEVPDELGLDLVGRPGGEFTEAQAPKSPPADAKDARVAKEVTETRPSAATSKPADIKK